MKISGIIESIEYVNTAGYEKKIVTITPARYQKAFIEFRGRRMDDLVPFKENDDIEITVELEGKVSKNSGIRYNNLVAVDVTPKTYK